MEPTAPLRLALAGQSLVTRPFEPTHARSLALAELLQASDLAFTNLECAIAGTHGGTPRREHTLHVAPPEVLDTLASYGFAMVALASNHAFDLGPEGIRSALDEVRARDIPHAGTGLDAGDARRPGIAVVGTRRVALVAVNASPNPPGSGALDARGGEPGRPGTNLLEVETEVAPPRARTDQVEALLGDIAAAAATSPHALVVYVHQHYWIPDAATTPAWLADLAHRCVDAGASIVVCHGPPVLHGLEIYAGRPVFYGLGSFVFQTASPLRYPGPGAWESVVATCEVGAAGRVVAIDLAPVVHGHHPSLGEGGSLHGEPLLAVGTVGEDVLGRYAYRSSQRHGTTIEVRGSSAIVRL